MQAILLSSVLLLVTLATAEAGPATSRDFGRFVSECESGDVCANPDQDGKNKTVTSLDGTLYCCSSDHSVTISVSRNTSSFSQSLSSSFYSSDSNAVFYSGGLTFDSRSSSNNNNNGHKSSDSTGGQNEVKCECREFNSEEWTDYFNDVRSKVWDSFKSSWDASWDRLSKLFK